MTSIKCETISEKLDAHTLEHKQDYRDSMLCVEEIKNDVKFLTHKFEVYLDENSKYREARQIADDKYKETMQPILDGWKAIKWIFGAVLAIGGLALLLKNLFIK